VDRRLREAARLGFRRAVVPAGPRAAAVEPVSGMEVIPVGTLREAIEASLGGAIERVASAPARC